jgi:hypothetical protein
MFRELFAADSFQHSQFLCHIPNGGFATATPVVFAESANVPNNAYVADLYEQVSFLGDLHRQIADSANGGKVRLKIGLPSGGS